MEPAKGREPVQKVETERDHVDGEEHQEPQSASEGLQKGDQLRVSGLLFLQNGHALVLERLAEFDDLSPLGVDGQGGHDEVGLLLHQPPDHAGPLLLAAGVVPLQGAVVAERQRQRVREIAGVGQVFEEVDAVTSATII